MSPATTEYQVVTAAGAVKLTTPERDIAVKRAKELQPAFPGIHVDVVTRYEDRRVTWRPRVRPMLRPALQFEGVGL